MRRQAIVLLTMTGLMLGAVSASASRAVPASPQARLKAVTVPDSSTGRELLLRMDGSCAFKTVQATDDTLFIDLQGARVGEIPKTARWTNGLLAGYRLLEYTDATGQPVVRVQIETRQREPFTVQQERTGLRLLFGQKAATRGDSSPAPASVASAAVPAARVAETPAASAAKGPVKVSDVSIKDGEAGQTFVDVATSGAASFQVLQLENPRRLVVDLKEAQNALSRKSYAAHSTLLRDVRIGQFREKSPAVVRVVADLSGDPAFDVHGIPGGIRIELRPRERRAAVVRGEPAPKREAEKPVEVAVAAPSPVPPPVRAESAPPSVPPPAPAVAQPASPSVAAAAPVKEAPKLDYQNALPAVPGSTQVAAAPRPAPPSPTPEVLQAARAARTLTAASLPADLTDAQGAAPGGAAQAADQPKYTGEPISVNLKEVDLKDFFRLIHEISGLNIIVDPNVSGSVTLVLDEVPWDQALDIVLKNNGLGKTLEGNVLRIAKLETLTEEQGAAARLVAARQETMPLVTVFRPVNYAKAPDIAAMIKSWVGGVLSKRGTILVDARTNTLIISDIQTQIPIIENIISKLDRKAKQVVIEARIVLATSTFSRSLASALNAGYFNRATVSGAATGVGGSASTEVPPAKVLLTPATASGMGAFAITNVGANYFINAAITAAETRSEAKTISRPTIITQNNISGTVTQGTQIPIQTTINNTISITYQSASLTLTVTPQITEDGNVFMNINVTNSSVGAVLTSAGPSINQQSAQTQVLVPDGGTVVFGGVTVTGRTKSATYVPLIGNIPIIGHLFKSSNVQDNDQELLFFVSPKVLAT